ncbi:MAG TPA: hypothetical protein VIS05_07045 [Ilumatobacter sp.]
MTNHPDAPIAPPPSAAPPLVTPVTTRRRSATHVVAIVVGCLMLVPGLAMVAGGGAMLLAQAVATDDDGYFRTSLERLDSNGVAIVASELWWGEAENEASPWILDWLDLDLRLRVAATPSAEVFVGIARSADVEQYLARASHTRVVGLDHHRGVYRQLSGSQPVGPPAEQDFWVASTSGPGEQELVWNARGGNWSVVVMNPEGAPDLAVEVEVGVRSSAVTPIGTFLLAIGGFFSAIAIVLLVIGIRGRPAPGAPVGDQGAPTEPDEAALPLPPPAGVAAGADDTRHADPDT